MAELIITDSERESATYLEWDDAALGKACKKIALILSDTRGEASMEITAACAFLVSRSIDAGSAETTIRLEGMRIADKQLGTWTISLTESEAERDL